MLSTTAGELCSQGDNLYCPTAERWDLVVIQCFDRSLIASAQIATVPLGSEDLRRGQVQVSLQERIDRISRSLKNLSVQMEIDHRNTLAYVLLDGLSASESFFMEALYSSGRFPCLFVGGSSAGKLDFAHSWLHDGQRKPPWSPSCRWRKGAASASSRARTSSRPPPASTSFAPPWSNATSAM